jgi:hypothetical protein
MSDELHPSPSRDQRVHEIIARRVKILSPPVIGPADEACGSWPIAPVSPLTGLLRGPMLGFSPSRVGLTNVPERQTC